MNQRTPLAWAGLLGGTGVFMGALGAHPIKAALDARGMHPAWETAVTFQLLHASALLGFAGWLKASAGAARASARWAVRLWAFGTVAFSGSIYVLCLGGPGMGPVTPLGGLALIAGWILAGASAWGS